MPRTICTAVISQQTSRSLWPHYYKAQCGILVVNESKFSILMDRPVIRSLYLLVIIQDECETQAALENQYLYSVNAMPEESKHEFGES